MKMKKDIFAALPEVLLKGPDDLTEIQTPRPTGKEELAAGKGSFYAAVLGNMARRISPAATHSSDPAVAMAMDAMQAGRLELAQDHLALLAVSLEQASLDGGRMDLAYQLAWLEEPPAGMYANRTALLQASAG
eukprot:s4670_g10.t1